MGTVVTQPVDPLDVDIVKTETEGGVTVETSWTALKTEYIDKLNVEKTWVTNSVTKMTSDIAVCNARSAEIDDIITAVNNL